MLLRKRSLLARLRTPRPLPRVLSNSAMEEAFQRERARVDRNRQVFSVVVLRQLEGRAAAARTAEVLGQRIRAYDTLGQLDQRLSLIHI